MSTLLLDRMLLEIRTCLLNKFVNKTSLLLSVQRIAKQHPDVPYDVYSRPKLRWPIAAVKCQGTWKEKGHCNHPTH